MFHAFAVILERFLAGGILGGACERQIANFEKLRRREKHHIDGIMVQRVAQAALVNHQGTQSRAFRFNGTG
jgi:NAD-dependent DNA ligase